MKDNKHLINYILKNKVHLGNSNINEDFGDFVQGVDIKNNKCMFDVFKQIGQIRKVCFLLKTLKKKKRPILFFGINQFGLDKLSKSKALFINQQIYNLSFTVNNEEEGFKSIYDFYSYFYSFFYSKDGKKVRAGFGGAKNYAGYCIGFGKKKIDINGYFFDSWGDGSFSNFHYLKSFLSSFAQEPLVEFGVNDFSLLKRFKNLTSISNFLNTSTKVPGAVVFFSRAGYDSFFKEFIKLGVPVICVVNSDESLNDIDYPLFGDNSCLKVISFYQKIIQNSLKSKNIVV